MKKIALLICCFIIYRSNAQIGLGITTPHPNAYFEISSTNKGVLLPRMNAVQRLAIAPTATAKGLLVFDTDSSAYMYWSGTIWQKMSSTTNGELWKQNGNHIFNGNTGRVGIGTASPLAKLHVADSSVVFASDNFPGPTTVLPPVSGAGSRMMWYAEKAALRSGYVDNNSWDRDSVGPYSFAMGYNTKALNLGAVALGGSSKANAFGIATGLSTNAYGNASIAMGNATYAYGDNSAALNSHTVSSGTNSMAIGNFSTAAGDYSFSAGDHSLAQGSTSTATGFNTHATGVNSTATGNNTYATGVATFSGGNTSSANGANSFAFGDNALANGVSSFAAGSYVDARGAYSMVMGRELFSKAEGSFAVGEYNDVADNPTATPSGSDRIFQIGNGSPSGRSNVMTVYRVGTVGINTINPSFNLDVTGNGRYTAELLVGGNVSAGGNLSAGGTLDVTGNATLQANAQIFGSTSVNQNLNVQGNTTTKGLTVVGVNPITAGMVLTSDVLGNASWQNPGGGLWAASGNDIYSTNTGNVGIRNSTPVSPLSFDGNLGDKISLWGTDPTQNYGFGVQSGLLQIHAGTPLVDDIAFGTGATNNFYEAMRIKGNGNVGIGTTNPTEKLQVNGKLKLVDGTQGAGKILSSDANGVASWVKSTAITSAVYGFFPGAGANVVANTPSVYINAYIDLPVGKWIVFGTFLVSQGGTGGLLQPNQSMWVRTSFSSSAVADISTGDIIGSSIMSGTLISPSQFGLVTGQLIVNNTSGAVKRYYVWGSMENFGGEPVGFALDGLGSGFWGENQLTAIPMN